SGAIPARRDFGNSNFVLWICFGFCVSIFGFRLSPVPSGRKMDNKHNPPIGEKEPFFDVDVSHRRNPTGHLAFTPKALQNKAGGRERSERTPRKRAAHFSLP